MNPAAAGRNSSVSSVQFAGRLALAGASLAGALFLAGKYTASEGPVVPSRSPAQVSAGGPAVPAQPSDPYCPDVRPLQRRVEALERQYRAAAFAAATTSPTKVETERPPPLPFPADLTEAQTPQHFLARAKAILEECFPEMLVRDADCSERPCIAWAGYDADKGMALDMPSCGKWSETMGELTVVVGHHAEGEQTGYWGIASLPPEPDLAEAARRRFRTRVNSLAGSYAPPQP